MTVTPAGTDQEQLVECGGLGEKTRSSDPQIAAKVNALAAEGHEITLADPVGLYLTGIMTNGMKTPDGADPATFWTPERGATSNTSCERTSRSRRTSRTR